VLGVDARDVGSRVGSRGHACVQSTRKAAAGSFNVAHLVLEATQFGVLGAAVAASKVGNAVVCARVAPVVEGALPAGGAGGASIGRVALACRAEAAKVAIQVAGARAATRERVEDAGEVLVAELLGGTRAVLAGQTFARCAAPLGADLVWVAVDGVGASAGRDATVARGGARWRGARAECCRCKKVENVKSRHCVNLGLGALGQPRSGRGPTRRSAAAWPSFDFRIIMARPGSWTSWLGKAPRFAA
jgi:hypothetical protein